jgi:hypothetical protein
MPFMDTQDFIIMNMIKEIIKEINNTSVHYTNRSACSSVRLGFLIYWLLKAFYLDCPQKLDTIWGVFFMERKVKYDCLKLECVKLVLKTLFM